MYLLLSSILTKYMSILKHYRRIGSSKASYKAVFIGDQDRPLIQFSPLVNSGAMYSTISFQSANTNSIKNFEEYLAKEGYEEDRSRSSLEVRGVQGPKMPHLLGSSLTKRRLMNKPDLLELDRTVKELTQVVNSLTEILINVETKHMGEVLDRRLDVLDRLRDGQEARGQIVCNVDYHNKRDAIHEDFEKAAVKLRKKYESMNKFLTKNK